MINYHLLIAVIKTFYASKTDNLNIRYFFLGFPSLFAIRSNL